MPYGASVCSRPSHTYGLRQTCPRGIHGSITTGVHDQPGNLWAHALASSVSSSLCQGLGLGFVTTAHLQSERHAWRTRLRSVPRRARASRRDAAKRGRDALVPRDRGCWSATPPWDRGGSAVTPAPLGPRLLAGPAPRARRRPAFARSREGRGRLAEMQQGEGGTPSFPGIAAVGRRRPPGIAAVRR